MICLTHRSIGALFFVLGAAFVFSAAAISFAANGKADPQPNPTIDLAEGKILFTAPDGWVRKTPRVRIIEHEFAVPASKGDMEDGRVTVMGAGGTVEANLDRWIAQFSQADGSETKNQVPEADRKKTISGLEVQMVDLAGTFRDMPRPFDPNGGAVERQNYRMLAAVIASPKLGNYFIKFYGPRQTVSDHAEEFHKMIAGLQTK
ncbi:MAG TPA: hypothetical protein VG056_16000 [Pirellulales bacterium]|nr:hypothetical protein [Pirellulales bacterium]